MMSPRFPPRIVRSFVTRSVRSLFFRTKCTNIVVLHIRQGAADGRRAFVFWHPRISSNAVRFSEFGKSNLGLSFVYRKCSSPTIGDRCFNDGRSPRNPRWFMTRYPLVRDTFASLDVSFERRDRDCDVRRVRPELRSGHVDAKTWADG